LSCPAQNRAKEKFKNIGCKPVFSGYLLYHGLAAVGVFVDCRRGGRDAAVA
jgi:hypothetical protein